MEIANDQAEQTINARNRTEKDRLEQERQAKLEAMKAEERTGIAGAEEFEPCLPSVPPLASDSGDPPCGHGGGPVKEEQDFFSPYNESGPAFNPLLRHGFPGRLSAPSAGQESLDKLVGLPRITLPPSLSPSNIPGEWHDSMLIAGWEYHETADSQIYRKPKQRPRYGGMR